MADKKQKTPEAVAIQRQGIRMTVSEDDLDTYLARGYTEGHGSGSDSGTSTPTKAAPAKATPTGK